MRRRLQTLLLLPLLASGCVTHKLWTESALDEWNEPAPNPNLRLYEDARRKDLLVVYDEFSERHCTTDTRAFYLQQNQNQLAQHNRPHFVKARAATGLPPVPLYCPAPNTPPGEFYAVTATNGSNFTFFSDGHKVGSCELPIYADGVGQEERIALTPVAATMDATIIGGWLGCCWLYMNAPGWNH